MRRQTDRSAVRTDQDAFGAELVQVAPDGVDGDAEVFCERADRDLSGVRHVRRQLGFASRRQMAPSVLLVQDHWSPPISAAVAPQPSTAGGWRRRRTAEYSIAVRPLGGRNRLG